MLTEDSNLGCKVVNIYGRLSFSVREERSYLDFRGFHYLPTLAWGEPVHKLWFCSLEEFLVTEHSAPLRVGDMSVPEGHLAVTSIAHMCSADQKHRCH